MISYEPPETKAVNIGDYIQGLGTVLDPDDEEMAVFIEEIASRARRSSQATAQAEIKLVRCTAPRAEGSTRTRAAAHVEPDSWESIIHDATGAGWMGEGVFDEKDFERIEAELVERCRRLADGD